MEIIAIESATFQEMKTMFSDAIVQVKELSAENFILKNKYLTPLEVGKLTGYNEKTIKIKKEEIGYITQGRDLKFKMEDVTRWMENYYVKPRRTA